MLIVVKEQDIDAFHWAEDIPFVRFLGIDACLTRQRNLNGLENRKICKLVHL